MEKITQLFAKGLLWLQRGFANTMNRLTNQLRPRTQKISLILFCLVTLFLSLSVLVNAIMENKIPISPVGIQHIIKPRVQSIRKPVSNTIGKAKVRQIYRQLESLQKGDSNSYKEMMRQRPGLLDSLAELARVYESN